MNFIKNINLHVIKLFIILIIMVSLFGCNSIKKTMSIIVPFYSLDTTTLDGISVISDTNSNGNMPVAIDIVFIYDKTVNTSLLGLTGPQWFTNKAGLLLRYSKELSVAHIEVVPRTLNESLLLPNNYNNANKVLLFANYVEPAGQHVADITQFNKLQIILKKSSYQLKEMEP